MFFRMILGHDNVQNTDVHYRSLTGEGNFNWRFVFHIPYLMNEDMTIVRTQQGYFQSRSTEKKFPCRLILQVWENDTFSKDDFLGKKDFRDCMRVGKAIKMILNRCVYFLILFEKIIGTLDLELSRMPRGSKGPEQCNLSMLEPKVPRINLFRTKRTKGWWPFKGNDLDENLTLIVSLRLVFQEDSRAL